MSFGNDSYFVKRIDNQRTTSTQTRSLRDVVEQKGNQATNQTNIVQSNNNTYSNPTVAPARVQTEERIQSISATFGRFGNWIFKFSPSGYFQHRKLKTDAYGRIFSELGIDSGTYKI